GIAEDLSSEPSLDRTLFDVVDESLFMLDQKLAELYSLYEWDERITEFVNLYEEFTPKPDPDPVGKAPGMGVEQNMREEW
ncbi:unnamed protein product, partial [Amoebophrya sp. A25]